MLIPLVVAVVVLGIAAYLLYSGGSELAAVYHILGNDPIDVRNLAGKRGPVEIEGSASPLEETGTVTAPFSGSECVAYTYEVEELRSSGKSSSWHTLDEGMAGVDFLVEDETGAVRVDPDGADIRLEDHSTHLSPGDELPPRIEAYVRDTEDVEPQDTTVDLLVTELNLGNEQRFTERRLDVGETVYVYGQVRRGSTPAWGSRRVGAVVQDGAGVPLFVISDTDERGTAWRFARTGLVRVGLGGILLVVVVLVAGPVLAELLV